MNTNKAELFRLRCNSSGAAASGLAQRRSDNFSVRALMLFCAMLAGSGTAPAVGAELLVIGGEGDGVSVVGAGLRTREWKTWASGERWRLSLAPEWQIGIWDAQQPGISKTRIVDSSLTGVLTVRPREDVGSVYYLDIGFGVHMLSHTRISEERNFGSSFQFGELVGIGMDFGQRRPYSVAARVQHVSNGGIKRPNPGVTFAQVLVVCRF